ncbi:MAG TPA: PrsW family intramembrane metalloprotease [Ignavibacteriaceae bacterium]
MLFIASFFAAVIPMSIYLMIIWRIDRYDREPLNLLLINFIYGAVGAIILAVIGSGLITAAAGYIIKNEQLILRFEAVVVAPIVEETTKGFFLFLMMANKKFDNITDGIVYGGAIGLGFGMTENFFYFVYYSSSFDNWLSIVIIRTLFSGVMHCVTTGTLGAFLGYAKFRSGSAKLAFPFLGLAIGMAIHSLWNLSVSFDSTAILGFLFMIFTIAVFITVFSISLLSEKKIIFTELLPETKTGLIPQEHLFILNSAKRNKLGWIDESKRKIYIKSATTLAFRKMQARNSSGVSKNYYDQDIENYRNFIRNLLSGTQPG